MPVTLAGRRLVIIRFYHGLPEIPVVFVVKPFAYRFEIAFCMFLYINYFEESTEILLTIAKRAKWLVIAATPSQ